MPGVRLASPSYLSDDVYDGRRSNDGLHVFGTETLKLRNAIVSQPEKGTGGDREERQGKEVLRVGQYSMPCV